MKRAWAGWLRGLADWLAPAGQATERGPVAVPLVRSEWPVEMAQGLEVFLRSDSGRAFLARMQAVATTVAVAGCRNTVNTVHSAGVSAGWDEAVRYMVSLSRVAGVQATNYDESPRGETELLEQLSP